MNRTLSWFLMIFSICLFFNQINAFPTKKSIELNLSADQFLNEDFEKPIKYHHHNHKHHIRHKHRRRSLTSEEETKSQRNKQIMLTKPYWPWP